MKTCSSDNWLRPRTNEESLGQLGHRSCGVIHLEYGNIVNLTIEIFHCIVIFIQHYIQSKNTCLLEGICCRPLVYNSKQKSLNCPT